MRPSGQRRRNLILGLIFAWTGLVWSVWLHGKYVGDFIQNDDCIYMDTVRNVARGEGLTSHTAYPIALVYYKERFKFPLPFLIHGMLPFLIYALGYWAGHLAPIAPLLTNGLILLLTNLFAYRLAEMLAGEDAGYLTLLILSVEPVLLDVNFWISTQPAFTLFMMMSTYYLFRFSKTPASGLLAAAAVTFGASQYCRMGSAVCFLPVSALLFLYGGARKLAAFLGTCAVLFIPWWMYYYRVTGSPNYTAYFIPMDFALGPNIMSSFKLIKYGSSDVAKHWHAIFVLRQLSIAKDLYREMFTWMNPLVFIGGLLSLLSPGKDRSWRDYTWYSLATIGAILWPGFLLSHVYPVIYLWSIPASVFILNWLDRLPNESWRGLALPILGLILLQPLLVSTFGVHGVLRHRQEKLQYRQDWQDLGRWIRERVPAEAVIYSNAAEWVAWHADRNVLFLAHDEDWTNEELARYPSDWIVLANENRLIGGDAEWNERIRRAEAGGKDFMGFSRVADFNGHTVQAGLFRRSSR